MQKYKTVNNTSYNIRTPDELCKKLEYVRQNCIRVRFFLGDTETGKMWADEYDTIGSISRSTGSVKIPILIKTERSTGGVGILDHCILRVDTSPGCTIWKAPNYQEPEIEVRGLEVYFNGFIHGICKSEEQASRLALFMSGKRWSK
jgi:hypothetical protein